MSSLGDLLLGNIPEPEDVQEKERQREYDDNDNKQKHIDTKPTIRERSPSDISNDGSYNRFALKEQKVFPERIEKKKSDKLEDDRRSNASSTDDLVRELLDPNDRPRNVWHVVAEGAEQKSPDTRSDVPDSRDNQEGPIRERSEDKILDQNRGNLDDDRSPRREHTVNGDGIEERTRDKSMDRDLENPGERSPSRNTRSNNDRDRDHHDRKRSKDRGGDRDRDRRRRSPDRHSKSTSKRSRYSDNEDDDRDHKRRRGGRSRRHGRRSRSRSPSHDSGSRRRRHRSRSDSRSPTIKRDSKTILVMQLTPRVVSRDLEDFFAEIGRVKEVRLIMDSKTRRHKGIAYIEFESASSAMKALDLNGHKFHGLPLQIQSALSEKQGEYQPAPSTSTSSYNGHHHSSNHTSSSHYTSSRSHHLPPNSYRVYMGGLNVGITDEMLRTIVEPFGMAHKVEVIKDRTTGLSRGYAFVTFASAEDGQEAIRNLDGFELAGKCMRVSKSTEKSDR